MNQVSDNAVAIERRSGEGGYFLLEALIVIALFGILGMSFANSIIFGINNRMRAVHRSAAMQIAADMLEGESTVDPSLFTDASGFTDEISWANNPNMRFRRTLSFVVNADGSRTATVTVQDLNPVMGPAASLAQVQMSTILAPWGSR